ncbi:MAG: hypothetical protein KAR39_12065 [Thermoplasmata archaeon]|nr:hypothetical protein [Thermoplasmata archaeon]
MIFRVAVAILLVLGIVAITFSFHRLRDRRVESVFTILFILHGFLVLLFLIVTLGATLLTFAISTEQPDAIVIDFLAQMGLWLGGLFAFGVIIALVIIAREKMLERKGDN